jgi:hypothetical protein
MLIRKMNMPASSAHAECGIGRSDAEGANEEKCVSGVHPLRPVEHGPTLTRVRLAERDVESGSAASSRVAGRRIPHH